MGGHDKEHKGALPSNRRARRAAKSYERRGLISPGARTVVVPGEGKDLTREGYTGGAGINPSAGTKGHGAK